MMNIYASAFMTATRTEARPIDAKRPSVPKAPLMRRRRWWPWARTV